MWVNNLSKVATQWNSGATRDSNRGRRFLIPRTLTTTPPSHKVRTEVGNKLRISWWTISFRLCRTCKTISMTVAGWLSQVLDPLVTKYQYTGCSTSGVHSKRPAGRLPWAPCSPRTARMRPAASCSKIVNFGTKVACFKHEVQCFTLNWAVQCLETSSTYSLHKMHNTLVASY